MHWSFLRKCCLEKVAGLWLLCLLSACASKPDTLLIATSANMALTMEELISAFVSTSTTQCEMVTGSSGKLYAQIVAGAPYHVFVSADTMYPAEIHRSGLSTVAPEIYAEGKLVLWSQRPFPNLEAALQSDFSFLAIPNPKVAPYGKAAVAYLENTTQYERLKDRLVMGENIGQTAQFLQTGTADMAIVSESVIMALPNSQELHWFELPQNEYPKLLQAAVLLNAKPSHAEAEAFYNFLFSAKAKEILNTFGYQVAVNE